MNHPSLGSPSGQIVALVLLSFGAGTIMMLALTQFLRGDSSWWWWLLLMVVLCFPIVANSIRLRKQIP
jgi:hypothetical protein